MCSYSYPENIKIKQYKGVSQKEETETEVTKAEQDHIGDKIQEAKAEKENTNNIYICNIFGICFMY